MHIKSFANLSNTSEENSAPYDLVSIANIH